MKTKVLQKMFRILECVVTHSPKPVLLPELVSVSGLNKQTCARLIADLVELGYLEHAGARKGFRAGIRAFALGKQTRYEPDLRQIAAPYVKEAAERLETFVTFSQMYNGQRYNLLEYNGCPSLSIDLRPLGNNDLAFTASGHVFLACMTPAEREKLFLHHPEILTVTSFMHRVFGDAESRNRYFNEVRKDGYVSLITELWGITAVPIFLDGVCIAAFASARPIDLVTREKQHFDVEFLTTSGREISRKYALKHIK